MEIILIQACLIIAIAMRVDWYATKRAQLTCRIFSFCTKQEATAPMLAEALKARLGRLYPLLRDMERQGLLLVREDHTVSHRRGGRPAFYYRSTLWEKTTTS